MAGEKILNIDDSPTVQRLIDMILSSQGYQVILASDGEEGIVKARSERPEVILVDFVMPKMNGFQVCKALKEDPAFRDTPIILVTSKGDKVGSKFVDVLGITEYFTKPFQPEELLAKIREVIDKKKPVAAPPEAAAMRPPAHKPPPAEPRAASAPADIEALVKDMVEKALEDFMKRALPDIIRKELARSLPQDDTGIKGNLQNFRIIELMQMLGLQRHTGRLVVSKNGSDAEIYFKNGAVVFATSACNNSKASLEDLLKRSCGLDDGHLRHALRIAEMTGNPIDNILMQEKMLDPKTFNDCLRRHTEREVYKVMAWREGNFYFEKAAPPQFANPVQLKVDDILLEGARRADEWMLIQQKIPNFEVVFEPMIGNADELTRRGLSDIDIKVFSLINGKRTAQEIIDASAIEEFDVAKSMFILQSVNLIRRKK